MCCISRRLATDQTIRIWNYETGNIELVRKYQVDVHVVELHNSGLLAAIGFADQLRVTQVFMDELNVCKSAIEIIITFVNNRKMIANYFPLTDCENLQFASLQMCEILELWTFYGGGS